jgi:hypothetical protein
MLEDAENIIVVRAVLSDSCGRAVDLDSLSERNG